MLTVAALKFLSAQLQWPPTPNERLELLIGCGLQKLLKRVKTICRAQVVHAVRREGAEELVTNHNHSRTPRPNAFTPNLVDRKLHFHVTASVCQSGHAVKQVERKVQMFAMSLKRAAEESDLSPRTLQYAIARGELESILVGRRRLILPAALESFLLRKGQTHPEK
jgi:hypothetical protein